MKINLISFSKLRYIQLENDSHSIELSFDFQSLPKQHGRYEVINGLFIGVFSFKESNYIYINDHSVEINSDVSIEVYCAEEKNVSWFRLYNEKSLVFEIEYINEMQVPYIDSAGMEDWSIHNFGSFIANCISKVKDDPSVLLFHL